MWLQYDFIAMQTWSAEIRQELSVVLNGNPMKRELSTLQEIKVWISLSKSCFNTKSLSLAMFYEPNADLIFNMASKTKISIHDPAKMFYIG